MITVLKLFGKFQGNICTPNFSKERENLLFAVEGELGTQNLSNLKFNAEDNREVTADFSVEGACTDVLLMPPTVFLLKRQQ